MPGFAAIASMANLYEIESGKLAEQKASGATWPKTCRTRSDGGVMPREMQRTN